MYFVIQLFLHFTYPLSSPRNDISVGTYVKQFTGSFVQDLQVSFLFTHHRTIVVVDSEMSSDDHETLSILLFRSIDDGEAFGFPVTPEEAASAGIVSRKEPQDAYLEAIQRGKYFICFESQYCWKADETKMLIGHVGQNATMSGNGLTHAFLTTENKWVDHSDADFRSTPIVAAPGTYLVGVVWRENLYVANVGDSRAVISRLPDGSIVFQQLTRDDNVRDPAVRKEVQDLHPDEPGIVKKERGAWRINGRIQVSKPIGDAFLKIPRVNLDNIDERYQLDTPLQNGRPSISAEPSSPIRIPLQAQDRFMIFASDGDLLSYEEVTDIVQRTPKEGIAARVIREGLGKVARNQEKSYDDILNVKVESGNQLYHDYIIVVVIILNQGSQGADIQEKFQRRSVKGGRNMGTIGETNFTALDGVT